MGMREEDLAEALGPLLSQVSVDTAVIEHDARYVVHSRRLLRSAMSYRIGGVDRPVLARSGARFAWQLRGQRHPAVAARLKGQSMSYAGATCSRATSSSLSAPVSASFVQTCACGSRRMPTEPAHVEVA